MRGHRLAGARCCRGALCLLVTAIVAFSWAARAEERLQGPQLDPQKLEHVSEYLRGKVSAGKIPGAILLIQQRGKPVLYEKFGMRNARMRQPMTDDTIFRLYSMSKPITSVAALMLVDDGKLALDEPVAKYIRLSPT